MTLPANPARGPLLPQNPALSGDPLGWYGCAHYGNAMGIHFDSAGLHSPSGAQVRAASGDPVAKDGSRLAPYCKQAAAHYGINLEVHTDYDVDDAIHRNAAGAGMLVALDYSPIQHTEYSGDPNFSGAHMIFFAPGLVDMDSLRDGRRAGIPKGPVVLPASIFKAATALIAGPGKVQVGFYPHIHPNATATPAPSTVYRYGGQPHGRGLYVITTTVANVRSSPFITRSGVRLNNVVGTLRKGQTFHCSQTTAVGQSVGGSRVWHGNPDGTRWVHSSVCHPA